MWKISGVFNGIRIHDLYDAGVVLSPTELWSHSDLRKSICWAHVLPWKEWWMKEMFLKFSSRDELKKWSLHLLDNVSNTWAQQIDLLRSEWLHSSVGKGTAPAT